MLYFSSDSWFQLISRSKIPKSLEYRTGTSFGSTNNLNIVGLSQTITTANQPGIVATTDQGKRLP